MNSSYLQSMAEVRTILQSSIINNNGPENRKIFTRYLNLFGTLGDQRAQQPSTFFSCVKQYPGVVVEIYCFFFG